MSACRRILGLESPERAPREVRAREETKRAVEHPFRECYSHGKQNLPLL